MSALIQRLKPKLMTAEEFFDFVHRPENDVRYFELVRGEVLELSRPRIPHGVLCVNVGSILRQHAFEQRKGFVTADSGVILERNPDTVRGPDVAYFEGIKTFADLPDKWADLPPRLAVEILSSGDRRAAFADKLADYLNNGVEMVWAVHPVKRTVTVYVPDSEPVVFKENQVLKGGPVLPKFRCKVADFFYMSGDEEPARQEPPRKRKTK